MLVSVLLDRGFHLQAYAKIITQKWYVELILWLKYSICKSKKTVNKSCVKVICNVFIIFYTVH
jgi:hypothetical protein